MDVVLVAAHDLLGPFDPALDPRRDHHRVLLEQIGHFVHRPAHPGPVAAADQLPDLALLVGHLTPPAAPPPGVHPPAPGARRRSRPPRSLRAVRAVEAAEAAWRRWPALARRRSRRRMRPARHKESARPPGSRTPARGCRRGGGRAARVPWSPARARSWRGREGLPGPGAA